jgi:hypothetical protein
LLCLAIFIDDFNGSSAPSVLLSFSESFRNSASDFLVNFSHTAFSFCTKSASDFFLNVRGKLRLNEKGAGDQADIVVELALGLFFFIES